MQRSTTNALMVGVILGCLIVSSIYYTLNFPRDMRVTVIQSVIQRIEEPFKLESGAAVLYNSVRVLCWVMTAPQYHASRARAVKETWGKRCNVLLFMSTEADDTLPTIKLNVSGNYTALWGKTRDAFRYVWENHRDEADWFLKADDDTYMVLENLRYFLSPFNSSHPMWFGHKYKKMIKRGYFSGGSGYVLSKEATKRFAEKGHPDKLICREDHNTFAEDVEMGKCMENLKVTAMDTRDPEGRGRFLPLPLSDHINAKKVDRTAWYWEYTYYPTRMGLDCCSKKAISFHYVQPEHMHLFEYLIYHLQIHGNSEKWPAIAAPDLDVAETAWSMGPENAAMAGKTLTKEEVRKIQIQLKMLSTTPTATSVDGKYSSERLAVNN